tara:strand:+ start:633 stop:800 length:168 start_codon:yes stop_codon:yes gene_type:complete
MKLPQMHSGQCFICKEVKETMFHNMHGDGKSYCYECIDMALNYYMFHISIEGEDL